MNVRTCAIILGRAGSKGLPAKNERLLAGKPCVQWTIEQAQRAHHVHHVVLSTDGDTLASIGERSGIQVVRRPEALASDLATVDDAARNALREIEQGAGRFDAVAILYANVPIRPEGLIDDAIRRLEKTGCDSVQSYTTVGKHHPHWTAVVSDTGDVRPWQGDVLNHNTYRRQDLPPAHIPDGGVIVCTREALMLNIDAVDGGPHAFFGVDRRAVLTEHGDVIDIDTEIDAIVAETVLRRRDERESAA